MNYKKFLLYTSFIFSFYDYVHTGVATLLEGMSDEDLQELIKQGEAQLEYYMKYATEEEKKAFDEAMTQTLQSFNDEDWNALQNVAEKIEKTTPQYQEPAQPTTPVQKTTEAKKETPTKPVARSVEDKIKELLSSVIKSIDKILNTIHGSKDLERHMKPWIEKSKFHELQKMLHFINRSHNIRRLATSSQENTDLIAALESFQKVLDLEQKNLHIYEDDFGRSLEITEQKAVITIDGIQAALAKGVESILPKINEFLTKYDPEALEFAKAKDEQAAKALELEKQNIRMAQQSQSFIGKNGGGYAPSSYQPSSSPMPERRHRPGQTNSRSQDYSSNRSSGNFPSNASNIPGMSGTPGSKSMPSKQKDAEKKSQKEKDEKEEKTTPSISTAYLNAIKEHFDIFQTDKQLEEVIKQAINSYPKIEKKDDDAQFVEEMREYIVRMKKSIKTVHDEITDLESITNPLAKAAKEFSKEDAKAILENKYFKKLVDKIDYFIKLIEDFKVKINAKYKANKAHLADNNQNMYIQLHNQIDSLYDLEDNMLNIDSYLQSTHKRLKARAKGETVTPHIHHRK